MRVRDRFENDLFFAAAAARHGPASVPEGVFYASVERPPPETSLADIVVATPMRYGLVVFALGWASILFQRSFLQQLVVGAPVFEELAKLGPPIVLVTLLRARSPLVRVPLAWLSGAAFGVFEHAFTYAAEDPSIFAGRIMFHGGSAALSMVVFTAVEGAVDVRARWVSTAASTLFHWANNFSAVVLGLGSLLVPILDTVATGLSLGITAAIYACVIFALAFRARFEHLVSQGLGVAIPRLGFGRAQERGVEQV